MRNENITHWVEPWQSESLSEMVPRGRERQREGEKWSGTACQFDLSRKE